MEFEPTPYCCCQSNVHIGVIVISVKKHLLTFDLSTPNHKISGIGLSQDHSLYQVNLNTFESFVFELCSGQTDRWIEHPWVISITICPYLLLPRSQTLALPAWSPARWRGTFRPWRGARVLRQQWPVAVSRRPTSSQDVQRLTLVSDRPVNSTTRQHSS